VAQLHHIEIQLDDVQNGRGLCVQADFFKPLNLDKIA
jgi:hypothetical protein